MTLQLRLGPVPLRTLQQLFQVIEFFKLLQHRHFLCIEPLLRRRARPTIHHSLDLDLHLLAVGIVRNLGDLENVRWDMPAREVLGYLLANTPIEVLWWEKRRGGSTTRRGTVVVALDEQQDTFCGVRVWWRCALLTHDDRVGDVIGESRRGQDIVDLGTAEPDAGRVEGPVTAS